MSFDISPNDTQKFNEVFPDEDSCKDHLLRLRWPLDFSCPVCEHKAYYYIKTRHLYECKRCGRQTSLTAGTVMHGTRIPLRKWFLAISLMSGSKCGMPTMYVQKVIQVSYPTAWIMCSKIRSAMQEQDADMKLAGIVQLGTGNFGARGAKRADKRTTGDNMQGCVVLSLDSEGNPARLIVQLTNTPASMIHNSFLKNYVSHDSILQALRQLTAGIMSKSGYNNTPDFSILSGKEIREVMQQLHAYIATRYRGYSQKHMQSCIDDFCYRFNRKFNHSALLHSILSACAHGTRRTYEELIA